MLQETTAERTGQSYREVSHLQGNRSSQSFRMLVPQSYIQIASTTRRKQEDNRTHMYDEQHEESKKRKGTISLEQKQVKEASQSCTDSVGLLQALAVSLTRRCLV